MLANNKLHGLHPAVGIFKPFMFIRNVSFLKFKLHAFEEATIAKHIDHYKLSTLKELNDWS